METSMEMKNRHAVVVATTALAGFSAALLLNIQFKPQDGLKAGTSVLTVSTVQADPCNCCNSSGGGGCAGR
jgi:hypothetical protein